MQTSPETGPRVPSIPVDTALAPARGLVLTHNARGQAFSLTGLKKWVRLNNTIFKAEKFDLCLNGGDATHLHGLMEWAHLEQLAVSLRVDTRISPANIPPDCATRLHDVFLCPAHTDPGWLDAWFTACVQWKLPVRVQVHPPLPDTHALPGLADRLARAVSVNVALFDPFLAPPRPLDPAQLDRMNALVRLLDARGLEANLLYVPFCRVREANWPHACNRPQLFLGHQHYMKPAYELAEKMLRVGPAWMAKAMENQLAREISVHNAIDRALFPWILNHPRVYVRAWMIHKLTRHLRKLQRKPLALPENLTAAEAEVEKERRRRERKIPKPCRACRMRRICDYPTPAFKRALPGMDISPIQGETVVSPLHFSGGAARTRHYDALDTTRREYPARERELAEEARRIIMREPHTREISTDTYEIEHHYTHHMPGAVRWLAFTPGEFRSTVLTRIEPPFTMSLTFGGGIAEYIGFAFGRTARVMCPMIDYTHRLTLHVAEDGHYVLLRDGVLVRPVEFEGERRLPTRLAGCLEPRIAVRNIDGFVITQTTLLWEHGRDAAEDLRRTRYSVVVINSRYARRLQAALLSLAHQEGIDFEQLEIVIGYIPGIDTTDDLIDSLQRAHPHLRIVRAPFSPDNTRSKGFMINECARVASGDWIVLLDADILLPPDFFRQVESVQAGAHFIAPDGRKMLTPETTARILLGDIRPWECHEELAQSAGDYRFREANRVPIGFCQCVRREVMEKVPYHELDHFEGSDWIFGNTVLHVFGPEKRLEGTVVLHLDHGGSQWYGTTKQM